MTDSGNYHYARDDFRYPRWLERLMRQALDRGLAAMDRQEIVEGQLRLPQRVVQLFAVGCLLLGYYLPAGLLIAIWIYLDELLLHRFLDRTIPAARIRHFAEEAVFPIALTAHMWLGGYWITGLAGGIGIVGMYLLTALQNKHPLASLELPNLYFLRWDRSGFFFLFIILGAWPGERSYLWPRLAAWFLPVLTFYDYLWILIQLMKKKK